MFMRDELWRGVWVFLVVLDLDLDLDLVCQIPPLTLRFFFGSR